MWMFVCPVSLRRWRRTEIGRIGEAWKAVVRTGVDRIGRNGTVSRDLDGKAVVRLVRRALVR